MSNNEARATYESLKSEYFNARLWTENWMNDYRKRLKAFFDDEYNHAEFYEEFLYSGIGESFYMANGYQILSDN